MAVDEAFAVFVREHNASLYRTAFLLTGSHTAAEDVLQETLTYLYPRWDRVQAADSAVAYVRRSLTNRFVSSTRQRAGRDLSMWDLPDGWDGQDLSETVANRELVWQLLGSLPARQRAAMVMRYFHDLPDDEIAASLGCRAATVRSLVSRGMALLRAQADGPTPIALRGSAPQGSTEAAQ